MEMEERNDELGSGCVIDGGQCIGCGECEDVDEYGNLESDF